MRKKSALSKSTISTTSTRESAIKNNRTLGTRMPKIRGNEQMREKSAQMH